MITASQKQHNVQLQKILSTLPADTDADIAHFITRFYAKMPTPDFIRLDVKNAVAIAKNAFEFIAARDGDKPKIRIFTPDKNLNGYETKYTVIELLNDDMPFLVDSLTMELSRLGLIIHETIHPIFRVSRDKKGNLSAIGDKGQKNESLIHFEISALPEGLDSAGLKAGLENVLGHIRVSVEDWREIVEKAKLSASVLESVKEVADKDSRDEIRDFLLWLVDKNFVFLGYAQYRFFDEKGRQSLSVVPDSRLGILKIDDEVTPHGLEAVAPELRDSLLVPQLIEITKSSRRSLVHRPVPMDYIGLKRFDKNGKVIGEERFLGLFTSNVYYQSTEEIPLIRQKVAHVLERSDFESASHDGKSLKTILEFLPRDEIFQMSEDEMFETSMGIHALEAKPRVRIFARKDIFERFISLMVFVPRECFSTELRKQIQAIIERAYKGVTYSFSTQINEAPLARLQLTVRTTPSEIPDVSLQEVEQEIAKCAYLWADLLIEALLEKHDEKQVEKLIHIYDTAFPQNYINYYNSQGAVSDIEKIEEALQSGGLSLELFKKPTESGQFFHLKIYKPNEEIALSDILPMLENVGFRVIEERPFLIKPATKSQVWIRDFLLEHVSEDAVDFKAVKPLLEELLLKVWHGAVENDRFNSLVIEAGLDWRQITLLRAYAKYLKQAGFSYGQTIIEQAFNAQPQIAQNIVALFEKRFTPALQGAKGKSAEDISLTLSQQLSQVASAVHDRILRRYMELINATLRTNYFQLAGDGSHKPVLSLKFNSSLVPELAKPVPFAEIFVYSVRVEGIHLRGGKVARGGLRWSDRADDFRTEVLGLMKAQMVKNSVIVPVGSKGGFIVKKPPAARDKFLEEGVSCYKLYIGGLLDITDNIVDGKIVPPAQTVRHDGDDPYLVVAADKGTARFSDVANAVSKAYNFWLGDAFASGGSAGYDHKEMGITARGAFISVRRHFAEMGVDIDSTPFTTVGIGDMAGDVFGNGMLLSKNIRLVAAFNHLHIFIDPNPDEKTGFAERQRLFELPRSNWTDYNAKLISKGGGVFERSAKKITLSGEAQAALGITKSDFTPDELIHAILLAPVDLLWNGGIGTYVKAEDESNDQVGDRVNNALRVNGRDLRCKIVGEGGNLGFTQKGRIEYAKTGGRINTDAIDNSAGVDCSDHEVNIKIAFSQDIASGKLAVEERNSLLAAMTDEVAHLVLSDNFLQTRAITIAQEQGVELLDAQTSLIHNLEKRGLLDRAIEFLPADKQLSELAAAKKGLTRPEIAVLLSYSKMAIYNDILDSKLPDDGYFISDLKSYFPHAMQEKFLEAIISHPLKREIIATVITNNLVNYAGSSFAFDMARDLNVAVSDVAAAYIIVRDLFNLPELWEEIEPVFGINIILGVQKFLENSVAWLLGNMKLPLDIKEIMKDFVPAIKEIKAGMASGTLEEKMAALKKLSLSFDIIALARSTKKDLTQVYNIYENMGIRLKLDLLRASAQSLNIGAHWNRLAAKALTRDLSDEQQRLSLLVISSGKSLDDWEKTQPHLITRFDGFMEELKNSGSVDLAKLTIALHLLRSFA
jgi:glutamate dehydrogenase